MKIERRIKTGKLKGWTVRKSKHGWYALYSSNGVGQTNGMLDKKGVNDMIKYFKL